MEDSSTSPKKAKFADPGQVAAKTSGPGLTPADRLLLLVRTRRRETVAVTRQTRGELLFRARTAAWAQTGSTGFVGFDKQSPPGGAAGVAGSASGLLVHPSQPDWDNW